MSNESKNLPVPAIERPRSCGECVRYVRNEEKPGHGWCDNWAGVDLQDDYVCEPNFGVKKERRAKP